jgi:hypothetical protein
MKTLYCFGFVLAFAASQTLSAQGTMASMGKAVTSAISGSTTASAAKGVATTPLLATFNFRSGATETVTRAMSAGELSAIRSTGKLSRGGLDGDIFVTSSTISRKAKRIHQRLALPQKLREVKVDLEVPRRVFSPTTTVDPSNGLKGGGLQRSAPGNYIIPARIKKVTPLTM